VNQVWKEGIVGTGQTIAVVGGTNLESADIQNFRDAFGITALGPNGSVQMENPPSTVCAAPDPSTNSPEGYLDAEWAGAMAPDATIDYVACADQGVTVGADLAAAYIVADPAHVQRVSVLSSSYGDCEALPVSEANQFYVSLWQQAAAEGITVVVAAGDTGADACQDVYYYPTDGISVDNAASTPYNIAAGGTDFSDVFSGTEARYWSATDGANFLSAQSYIPEMAWNESCGNPLVLARFGQNFSSSFGPNGFCTYASQQPVDPDADHPPYFWPYAGSGGLSKVSARPAWQTGVAGIPQQGGRAVPDISMFASNGFAWNQTLIMCDSPLAGKPAGAGCDFSNPDDVYANLQAGTSLVAPAFAGIMALIDQKSGDRQGQANYVLYPLAAEQYVSYASSTQPSLANCAAYLGPQVLSSCYFHDISATPNPQAPPSTPFLTDNTAVPCTGTATSPGTFTDASTDPASNNENCYGYQITVTTNGSSLTTTPDYYGGMSTAEDANSPAFPATPGYDLATGLGSPNVYNLVNAPQWAGGGLTTSVRLSPQPPSITSVESVNLVATVTDQDNVPVMGGTVTFYSGNTVLGAETQECAPGGVFSLPVTGSTLGPVGIYGNVFASFAGGSQQCQQKTATYYGSQSSPSTVAVVLERIGKDATRLLARVPHPPGISR
jgi:subtilase family serine protease